MDCSICVTRCRKHNNFSTFAASRVPSLLTLQQLGVVGVGEVEALQGAGDPGEVLPAAGARSVQHRGAAGDLRDQHAPVPAVRLCAGEFIFVHHELC